MEIRHNILFLTEKEYDAAMKILAQPTMVELPTNKRWPHKKTTRHRVILQTKVGSSDGQKGRSSIWMIESIESGIVDHWWNLIQKALAPLNPYYTDNISEVVEFLGR